MALTVLRWPKNSTETDIFVYALLEPETEKIRYIGKTVNGLDRVNQHMCPRFLKSNTHKNNWIKKLLRFGKQPLVEILSIAKSDGEVQKLEKFWIKHLRENGEKLTNMTDGGEGTAGHHPSPEQIAKRVMAQAATRASPEHRIKMSKALTGRTFTESWCRNIGKSGIGRIPWNKGQKMTLEYSENISKFSTNKRPVIDGNGTEYASIVEAAGILQVGKASIQRVLRGLYPSVKGHTFQYKKV